MAERESPLAGVLQAGRFGNVTGSSGVTLSEVRLEAIVEAAAWPGAEKALMEAIEKVTGLALPDGAGGGAVKGGRAAFGIAPGRFLVTDMKNGLAQALDAAVSLETGTVTDLSHGRTAIRIAGPRAEWVLAKFFALDFSLPAFPIAAGRATAHHDIFAQIQRTSEDQFDLYVFRSFARSFWTALCHGAEEVGYEVD